MHFTNILHTHRSPRRKLNVKKISPNTIDTWRRRRVELNVNAQSVALFHANAINDAISANVVEVAALIDVAATDRSRVIVAVTDDIVVEELFSGFMLHFTELSFLISYFAPTIIHNKTMYCFSYDCHNISDSQENLLVIFIPRNLTHNRLQDYAKKKEKNTSKFREFDTHDLAHDA